MAAGHDQVNKCLFVQPDVRQARILYFLTVPAWPSVGHAEVRGRGTFCNNSWQPDISRWFWAGAAAEETPQSTVWALVDSNPTAWHHQGG